MQYLVTKDVQQLVSKWAIERGFAAPEEEFFNLIGSQLQQKLKSYFPQDEVWQLPYKLVKTRIDFWMCTARIFGYPVIALDDGLYVERADFYLQTSRLINVKGQAIGLGSRISKSLEDQVEKIAEHLEKKKVTLVDEGAYTGSGIIELSKILNNHGISVKAIILGIATREASENIKSQLPDAHWAIGFTFSPVIDWVCERDFYPGVPLSGRLIGRQGLPIQPETGAPYLIPFGDPEKWASIPLDKVNDFSRFCLEQAILLWKGIEKCSGKIVRCCDLSRRPLGIPLDDSRFVNHLSFLLKALL